MKEDLLKKGWEFSTTGDTEVVLTGYMEYGPDFVKQMNGIFAFGIMDPVKDCLVLFRDRLGVKPLFYTCFHDQVIFSSEIKGLFAYPGVTPKLDKKGLNEIFSIGPAKTYGCGVFKDIEELLPAHYLVCNAAGLHTECYWKLESKPHTDSYEQTVEKTAFLVRDAICRQIISDVPVCTFCPVVWTAAWYQQCAAQN